MARYRIEGGHKLSGSVQTQGSKNAALPLLAAGLLFRSGLTLTNLPAISDVKVMTSLLGQIGADVTGLERELTIKAGDTITGKIDSDLAGRLRASILFMGPVLARSGSVTVPSPGGDLIGRRPITVHLQALEAMGAKINETPDGLTLTGELRGADLYLEEASVTATENILMAATLAKGTTIVHNAAQEAHIHVLIEALRGGGANIVEIGLGTIIIHGTGGQLLPQRARIAVPADELDAATFAVAALVTHGTITIHDYPDDILRPFTEKVKVAGANITHDNCMTTTVSGREQPLSAFTVKVGLAPGFPTDLQPIMTVLATQADGKTLIHDWMYEQRLGYAEKLTDFGAKIEVLDPHRITVTGPTPLTGQSIAAPDIRAGIAFVLTALAAHGTSIIDKAEIIDRGYEKLAERLTVLGAKITREE